MSNELKGLELDHFLVEHTMASSGIIADAVNERSYETIYVELCTDAQTQEVNRQILQAILDGEVAVDEALVPKRDAQWVIFSKFRQMGARVVVIDKCFNDLWKAPIIVSSAEGFAASVFLRGHHNQLREPHMAMQVEQDWLTAGKPSGAKAMITGRQHIYPSVALGQKGANARRIILDGQEMPLLEPVLGIERVGVFDEVTALIRAIRYETRPKEHIHARLIEIWHNAQSEPYQPLQS